MAARKVFFGKPANDVLSYTDKKRIGKCKFMINHNG